MNNQLKLLYFTADSCSVCDSLLPKINQLIHEKYPQISLVIINTKEQIKLAADYGVFTIPMLILTIDDNENDRWVRSFGLVEVEKKLERLISIMN
jgi:thioredoxin-like negative regulator of GroEL